MTQCRWILVLASLAVAPGCNSPTAPVEPSSMEVLQRPDTLVAPGATFDSIAIRVLGAAGQPLAGVLVEWSADGEITAFAPRTDEDGIARAAWSLPGRTVYEHSNPAARTGPSGSFAATATIPGLNSLPIRVRATPFTVDTVDASHNYACGLRGTELWCWGAQYPLSPTHGRHTRRVALPPGLIPTAVSAGEEMLCFLDQLSKPICAIAGSGDDFVRINGAPGLRSVTGVGEQMCGIGTRDRAIWCWEAGNDAFHGQVVVHAQPGPFVALAGGWDAACGLAPDGTAHCWGRNDRGQLGDATNIDRIIAAPVAGAHRFVSIAAGEYKFCGSEDNGVLWCWGQLGLGVRSNVPMRFDVPGVRGPDFRVGLIGELYTFPQRQLLVHGEFGEGITRWFNGHTIRQFSLDHSACLRNMQDEVFCSWDVLRGVITHAWAPLEPIPVPPPRNGW